jgi:formimidoylglutamate deiminase
MFPPVERLAVAHLHHRGGWLSPGFVEIDPGGTILAVYAEEPAEWSSRAVLRSRGYALPGLPNLHSHAFQRLLAGRAERASSAGGDSFWTWRTEMYRLAEQLDPETLEAVAAQLDLEMLEAGYTAAAEFHYLHHPASGGRYADRAAMSRALIRAADRAGLALTLLPVLYQRGGFGQDPAPEQRPFLHPDPQDYLRLVADLRAELAARSTLRIGIAPHSLRAVEPDALAEVVAGIVALDPDAPIHLHAAEQPAEVEACRTHLGARPVEWLLDHQPVDRRWCLIHATHTTEAELDRLAKSGAVAGLCPTTEANLGDGIFGAARYLGAGGSFGVGSDSNSTVDPAEELRWLEYGQRLTHLRRSVLSGAEPSVGRSLWDRAALGGAEATAQPAGEIAVGRRADLVVLDPEHPRLAGHGPDTVLDAWIFGSARGAIAEVIAAGSHVVSGGVHRRREEIGAAFRAAMARSIR